MTRLALGLLKFKTFLLARNLYASITTRAALPSSQDATLMEHVVGQGAIPYGSSAYDQAREVYRENLERIIAAARSRSVPIMFTALVSNLRTHAPFRPVFAEGTPMEARAQHAALMRSADSLIAMGDARGAFERSSHAVRLDSTHAGGWFSQGTAAYALGRYDTADREFRRAKDLDALRFRATEDFQGVLFSVCAEQGVPVIRADSAFGAASPHGIPGSELMTDHLHPNIRGYFLIGKVMAEAIRGDGLLSPPDHWRTGRDLTDEEYMARSTVSDFDSLCGVIRVELLMQHWPFPSHGGETGYTPATPEAVIAYAYVLNMRAWSLARYDMASHYEKLHRFDLARRECLAIAKAAPFSYEPLLRAADYLRMEGNAADAERYYRLSFQTENNPFARMKLAVVLLEGERSQEAAEQLVETLDLERRAGARLDAQSTVTARYLLAVALARTRQFGPARENLEVALQLDPGNASARDLQRQIDAYEKQMRGRR